MQETNIIFIILKSMSLSTTAATWWGEQILNDETIISSYLTDGLNLKYATLSMGKTPSRTIAKVFYGNIVKLVDNHDFKSGNLYLFTDLYPRGELARCCPLELHDRLPIKTKMIVTKTKVYIVKQVKQEIDFI